jgi:hypothetical protein
MAWRKSMAPKAVLLEDLVIHALVKARAGLIRTYVLHIVWFMAMCAFLVIHRDDHNLKASIFLTVVTILPVSFYTIRVHRLCRSIDPAARTVGLVTVVITTLILSPFESGLVLPAKNLIAANRILRIHREKRANPAADLAFPGATGIAKEGVDQVASR